jgi:hypothetical protein
MLGHQISIIQANVGAKPGPILSMLNDSYVADFDVMCISEPYIFPHPTTGEPTVNQHNGWGAITP